MRLDFCMKRIGSLVLLMPILYLIPFASGFSDNVYANDVIQRAKMHRKRKRERQKPKKK